MSGIYESYLVRNNKVVFRDFCQFYKDNDSVKFQKLQDFEKYFKQNEIVYKVHKQKYLKDENGTRYIFLLKKNNVEPSVYLSVFLTKERIDGHIFYNIKDTINALPWNATDPYRGEKIED